MFSYYKTCHPILRFLLVAVVAWLIAAMSWNEGIPSSTQDVIAYEQASQMMAKHTSDGDVVTYCNRAAPQHQDLLNVLLKSFVFQWLLLLCFVNIFIELIRKTSLKLFFIRIYYFIVDLDSYLLSSRAHPPTR